ncbi:MAG: chemotaxis protein CheX [Candidatus Melainabacteria bacterium]
MKTPSHTPSIDADIVNAFATSTVKVLRMMTHCDAELLDVSARRDFVPVGDISSLMMVLDSTLEGMIVLTFPQTLARKLASSMLGAHTQTVSVEMRLDFTAELVNMIVGHAKSYLNNKSSDPYRMTLPIIITGIGHEIHGRLSSNASLVFVFKVHGQTFSMQISFTNY